MDAMRKKIIVDSCCDLTPELMQKLGAVKIPLTLRLGGKAYLDDDSLNLKGFMQDMAACKEKIGSAAPAPALYQDAYEEAGGGYVVTLSDRMSSSYDNAVLAKNMATPEVSKQVHVFNSKSGTAGEVLVALKLHDLQNSGATSQTIVSTVDAYINAMKTYFVLENHDNLEKNGRLSRVKGTLAKVLNMKLVMGTDGQGNIKLYAKPRGIQRMIATMMDLITQSGKGKKEDRLVITHCNNPALAERLKEQIEDLFHFGSIVVCPTGGVSSLYADRGGVVLAF